MTSPTVSLTTTSDPAPGRVRRGATPLWWRDLTGATAWALVLFVVALWVHGGGLGDLTSWGDGLTSVGRLTGLLASVLLLIQVALMARVPLVEQAWGQDELARVHRLVGFTSIWLMLAHIVLVTLGYANGTTLGVVGTFVDQVLHSGGMLLALAGTLALGMVVVTSIRRARHRLRYESWHLLHLYAYLGAGLALPHQLWTGTDFRASAVSTIFWWGLYAAVLAAVVVFRLLLPFLRSRRHRLVVHRVVPEAPGLVSVHVTGRDLQRLPVRAGQFFQWRFLDGPGWTRANPYSLSAAPDGRSLRITARVVGDSTGRLAGLRPGVPVAIEGPYGRLHEGVATSDRAVLIGAGIGITPLRALLESLPAGPDRTVVIQRVRSGEDVLGRELEDLARSRGGRFYMLAGPRIQERESWLPEQYSRWADGTALRHLVPDIAERDVYVCGPTAWMDAVVAAARQCGVPDEALHTEQFAY
ncbi:MAG: ferredoxin reductase family protein [Intrasporangium sp.]|uniref:ferredoxin reductase family protein n=1 Tax=Intrasporangium sp. TaxID=1925024 RepID=UPI003F81BC63